MSDTLRVKYAGFWIRVLPELIDSTLLTLAASALEYVLLGIAYMTMGMSGSLFDAFPPMFQYWFQVGLYTVLSFPYYVVGHYRYGTTLGKKLFGVYVVKAETFEPITMKQSVLRFLGYGASYLLVGCGFLMAAFHPEKRGLHELIAGTVSIRKKRGGAVAKSITA